MHSKKTLNSKAALLGILMLASILCSGQGTVIDSLRSYSLPVWKVWRIARDLNTLDRQSILLDSARKVIALKNDALKSAVLQSQALDSAYQAKDNESKACLSLVGVNEQIHKSQLKTERTKGRKETAIIFIILDILLVLALL